MLAYSHFCHLNKPFIFKDSSEAVFSKRPPAQSGIHAALYVLSVYHMPSGHGRFADDLASLTPKSF